MVAPFPRYRAKKGDINYNRNMSLTCCTLRRLKYCNSAFRLEGCLQSKPHSRFGTRAGPHHAANCPQGDFKLRSTLRSPGTASAGLAQRQKGGNAGEEAFLLLSPLSSSFDLLRLIAPHVSNPSDLIDIYWVWYLELRGDRLRHT